MKLTTLLPLAMLATAGIANAQAVPHPGACKSDAQKLCSAEVATMDRSKVQTCLMSKVSQISSDCKENMIAMKKAQAATAAPAGTKQ